MHKLPHLFLPDSLTTTVEIPVPEHCTCESPAGAWRMTVEEGYVHLIHTICNLPLYGDLMQAVVMDDPIFVTLTSTKEPCCCPESCDCDYWLVLKETR